MANVGPFELVFVLGFLVLTIAWIVLPFALIGIKPLLRDLLAESKRANDLRERRLREPSR